MLKRRIGAHGVFAAIPETAAGSLRPVNFFLGNFMGWFLILLFFVVGVPVFTWAYRRHLDVLTGPWIANEMPPHD
jgi:hypothetical protein